MQELENISTEQKGAILIITVNRPSKMNALDQKTLKELSIVIKGVYENDSIGSAIVTGSGEKAFVAGADIQELSELTEFNARKFSEVGQEVFARFENCPKPIIAAVNGFALGGGCELAMACHMRLASENARFGLPEVSLGIIPGFGGTQRMTQLVGKGKAMELMMTGDMIDAQEALRLGLVNHVCKQDELMEKAIGILDKIAQKAPLAIAQVVECVNAAYNEEENGYQTEANSFGICCKTEDFQEGTKAFLEKRKPVFHGR